MSLPLAIEPVEDIALLSAAPFLVNVGILFLGWILAKVIADRDRGYFNDRAGEVNRRVRQGFLEGSSLADREVGVPPEFDPEIVIHARVEYSIHLLEAATISVVPVLSLVLLPNIPVAGPVVIAIAITLFILGLIYFFFAYRHDVDIDNPGDDPWIYNVTLVGCAVNLVALGVALGFIVSSYPS